MHFWDQPALITEDRLAKYIMTYPKTSTTGNRDDGSNLNACLFNMDNTPRYSRDRDVPQRISDLIPNSLRNQMRFILIVREPVTRLQSVYQHFASHFWHDAKTGTSSCMFGKSRKSKPKSAQPVSFSQYMDLTLQADDAKSADSDGCAGADGINFTPETIALFQKEFGPGSVLTITYEYMSQNPVEMKQAVSAFLGINATTSSSFNYDDWVNHYNPEHVNTRAQHKHEVVQTDAHDHVAGTATFNDCLARVNRMTDAFRGTTERLYSLVTGPNAPTMQPKP